LAENGEDRSREDLTEEASPHRVEEYRRKGMVAQSKELTSLAALLATAVTTYTLSPHIGAQISDFMREVFRTDLSSRLDLGSGHILADYLEKSVKMIAAIGLPISAAGFIVGILGSFVQIGAIFTVDPLTPDMEKINPLSGFQRLFSMRQAVDNIRLVFKMIVVIAIAYFLIKAEVLRSPSLMATAPAALFGVYGHAAKVIFLSMVSVLGLFGVVDFIFQRMEYSKKIRMTKQEAKQEHREREGDPQIKARIRAVQREMARRRMMSAVKKADVIITNPTHFAIAIVYDKKKMAAPKVVAKGADFLAQRIKKVAADAGVPLVENVPLARTLYKSVKVGQYVPRALYQAIAEILAYVYRLKNRTL